MTNNFINEPFLFVVVAKVIEDFGLAIRESLVIIRYVWPNKTGMESRMYFPRLEFLRELKHYLGARIVNFQNLVAPNKLRNEFTHSVLGKV
jgi:hypothetical protein